MPRRAALRAGDILATIHRIEDLLAGRSLADLDADRHLSAALERYLEILSEATRHLPEPIKARHPEIPWRRIADLGNVLRHVYHRADIAVLLEICVRDIPALKALLPRLIADVEDEAR